MQPIKDRLREKVISYYPDKGNGRFDKIGEVASKVGVSAQNLRDVHSKRSSVTLDMLLGFAAAYPGEFDELIEEAFGVKLKPQQADEAEVSPGLVAQLMALIADLRQQVATQQQMIKDLQADVKDYAQGFKRLALKDVSFSSSSSQTTAPYVLNSRVGYHREQPEPNQPGGKVIDHPATAKLVKVIRLNSRPAHSAQSA